MPTQLEEAFQALNLEPTANKKFIRKESLKILMQCHPDRVGENKTEETDAKVKAVNAAREFLDNLTDAELTRQVRQLQGHESRGDAILETAFFDSSPQQQKNQAGLVVIPSVISIIKRTYQDTIFKNDKFSVFSILVGDDASGRNEFYNHAFKSKTSYAGCKQAIFNAIQYQFYNLSSHGEYEEMRKTIYYKRANLIALFGNYDGIKDSVLKTQGQLTSPDVHEEVPEFYYMSYNNGRLSLCPWGDVTEEQFNAEKVNHAIPLDKLNSFMSQFYAQVNDMMLLPQIKQKQDEITGSQQRINPSLELSSHDEIVQNSIHLAPRTDDHNQDMIDFDQFKAIVNSYDSTSRLGAIGKQLSTIWFLSWMISPTRSNTMLALQTLLKVSEESHENSISKEDIKQAIEQSESSWFSSKHRTSLFRHEDGVENNHTSTDGVVEQLANYFNKQ